MKTPMKNQLKPRFGAFLLLAALSCASSARAQSGMPDLSDFAGAIAQKAEKAPPKKAVPIPKGGFTSGLVVPRVKPGEGARAIGRLLRVQTMSRAAEQPELKKLEPALLALENEMPSALTKLEAALQQVGFAPRDMGTAYAYAFMDLHDNAVGKDTSEKASLAAMRTLSSAIGTYWAPKYKAMTPAAKEKMYESLLIATTLNTLLTQQFVAVGKTDEADAMRKVSAEMFQTLIGVPVEGVKISQDGQISGLSKSAGQENEAKTGE